MTRRPVLRRPPDPADLIELRRLRQAHPELASAIDLQIELVQLHRRIQARVPLPTVSLTADRIARSRTMGRPLLQFNEIPIDWTDLRFALRETGAVLHRHGVLAAEPHGRLQRLARLEAEALGRLLAAWYAADRAAEDPDASVLRDLDEVVTLAMRPFLVRCAEALLAGADLGDWRPPHCPLCGGEPEFAAITPAAERLLACSRCTGLWRYDPLACPFCENADPRLITSFASRDGQYRLYACERCRRYLKAFDGRRSRRPLLLAFDTIATLPLDAAAMERGYRA